MAYSTKRVETVAEGGEKVTLVVPTSLPSQDRAEYLRQLFSAHVVLDEGTWKGKVHAVVPNAIADDVAEAMEFMGALVDYRHAGTNADGSNAGLTLLSSKGYYAHGF